MPDSLVDITPDTKVGALLEAYPGLEAKLIELAPAFGKLRNPILRKTIGKIATLRQAAEVAGIPLGALINMLRREAGIGEQTVTEDHASSDNQPAWFAPDKVVKSFDARPMLESGEHPVGIVMEHLKQVPSGGVYELITPFLPAPLLDMAKQKGFQVWSVSAGPDCVKSYLTKI
jgi:hypothetical protein